MLVAYLTSTEMYQLGDDRTSHALSLIMNVTQTPFSTYRSSHIAHQPRMFDSGNILTEIVRSPCG